MFEDLIKKKEEWKIVVDSLPDGTVKIWGQKTVKKPPVVWDIKKHKAWSSSKKAEPWYAPAGIQRGKIKVPKNN